jgi:hypothetical protein
VSWPPPCPAWAIRASVIERTSAPVWRASVTKDLPEAMSEHGRSGRGARSWFRAGGGGDGGVGTPSRGPSQSLSDPRHGIRREL